ncbi:hypothetical protein CA54_42210 [Symmachiella macrocystis]|uniref:Uncharacterized protein n=1 Tax=Symmachiella macrocystis TaxID=2527985 RepID=A0A5C6BBW5_9PLAN|nr:hypothetical protein CA54_42210 [Symmachiella macrocystis]
MGGRYLVNLGKLLMTLPTFLADHMAGDSSHIQRKGRVNHLEDAMHDEATLYPCLPVMIISFGRSSATEKAAD